MESSIIEKPRSELHIEYGEGELAALRKREAAVLWKLDCYIAPVMMLLMLISYLDRGNIGFAATQGLSEDINLQGSQLNIAISIFYIFYILAEFPTSILVKRLQFNRVIPAITFCWGLVFASALSGAFGGLLAYAILYMDGTAGYPGWRWLYIIEGIITIVWAFICIFVVPKNFETAYFLNDNDRVIMRIRAEATAAYSGGDGHYTLKDVKRAASDIKINVWGAIVYGVGAVLSDRYKARFLSLIISAPFGIAGYAILLCDVSAGVRYFATFLIATACFLCTGTNIAWLGSNCAPDGKRAASVGILLTLTNIGGVVAGQIYQTESAPAFTLGHSWSLGCLAVAWLGWWVVLFIYKRREAGKDKALARGEAIPPEEWTDRAHDFKYQF
ncbi:hypothetical protein Plec18170_009644 [Paecilomyces lecythidis]